MNLIPLSLKTCFITFLAVVFLCPTQVSAQQEQINSPDFGERVVLHSDILKEDREIFIYSPKNADNTFKACPVLYVLDAENHFNLLVEYSKSLSRWDVGVSPPLIIVGIKNTNRERDLSPSQPSFPDTSAINTGGNEPFFKFIRNELKPYITSHYKTEPYSILAGHSLGGIATVNCMLQHPEMFNAYIAASPSFWWGNNFVIKRAEEKLKVGSSLSKTLFVSDGNEGVYNKSNFHINVLKFDSLLRHRNLKNLDFVYQYYPLENHGTVPFKTYYEALRYIYKDWEIPMVENEGLNASFVKKHYQALSEKFGYQIIPDENLINDWAEYLLDVKFTANAISLLELATSYYSGSYKTFGNLAKGYLDKGEKQKAIEYYKKALVGNPGSKEMKLKLQELQK